MSSRPPACGALNSLFAMPMPLRKHPRLSALPVRSAICGMSPSMWFRGRRATPLATAVFAQSLVVTRKTYRHFPLCATNGTFVPVGTSESVKLPLASLIVTA
jgi:hypothetical protein